MAALRASAPLDFLLFDWDQGGHHPLYLQAVATALEPLGQVGFAAPAATLEAVPAAAAAEHVEVLEARPHVRTSRHFAADTRAVIASELELFRRSVERLRPRHTIHLFGDTVLRGLVRTEPLPTQVSLVAFRPRLHYPRDYGSALTPSQRITAAVHELLVQRWRRRRDAHALFSLDEGAVRRWRRVGKGAPAFWFPEPPVEARLATDEREGCVVFGRLSQRKGIAHLRAALSGEPTQVDLTLAGPVDDDYRQEYDEHVRAMRAAGVRVRTLDRLLSAEEGLAELGRARAAIITYEQHWGMSRVLLEAAAVGTPVVAWRHGLIGHLVERGDLGQTVPVGDTAGLRTAVVRAQDADPAARREALAQFATRYDRASFNAALRAPFGAAEQHHGGARCASSM